MPIEFFYDAESEIQQLREAVKLQHRIISRLATQVNEISYDLLFIQEMEAKREKWRQMDEDYDRPKNWRLSNFYEIYSENQIFGEKLHRRHDFFELNQADFRGLRSLSYRPDIEREIEELNRERDEKSWRGIPKMREQLRYTRLRDQQRLIRRKLRLIRLRSHVTPMRRRTLVKPRNDFYSSR